MIVPVNYVLKLHYSDLTEPKWVKRQRKWKAEIPQSATVCTGKEETWKSRMISEYVQHKVRHVLRQRQNDDSYFSELKLCSCDGCIRLSGSQDKTRDKLSSLSCLSYHVRGRNLARFEWVTAAVVSKHDDSADRRTGHNHTQTHLVDNDSPECESRHN